MTFLDTSVLVAAAQSQHAQHVQSATLIRSADRTNTACALHSFAETFSVLSGMPRPFRMPPAVALQVLRRFGERVRTVALTEEEYLATLESMASRGLMGGIVYDALLLRCARKVQATRVYSLNPGDFRIVDPELASRVMVP